jgi:hypothetical protein
MAEAGLDSMSGRKRIELLHSADLALAPAAPFTNETWVSITNRLGTKFTFAQVGMLAV